MTANLKMGRHGGYTIGVRDSGVGGLTVARRILARLPEARILYFADTAHVPYGDKAVPQIQHYALSISQFLLEKGAGAVVFACNTTSAYALDLARQRFTAPCYGVIEPGARLAARVSRGRIGVMATAATVQSGVYTQSLHAQNAGLEVVEVGCPAFVPLIESRLCHTREAVEACRHYLAPLLRARVDTIILGCTHYPLLLDHLQHLAPDVHFVDPADGVTEDLLYAVEHGAITAESSAPLQAHRFFVSGPSAGVDAWVTELLHLPAPVMESGPVFDFDPTAQPEPAATA